MFTPTEKWCQKCQLWLKYESFYKNKTTKSGLTIYCQSHELERSNKKWNSPSAQNGMLKRVYGITLDQYNMMKKVQDGRCFICDEEKKLVIDHNHETGRVRKLLCFGCNMFIGFLEKKKQILLRCMDYIEDDQHI